MLASVSPAAFAASMVNTPLAMSAQAAEASFGLYSTMSTPARATADAARARPYNLADGVATISFHGQSVNRPTWLTNAFGFASYEGLAAALRAALADNDVCGIILDFDSPGGEFAGATEAADMVRRASMSKPVVAFVDSLAASAAYAIAAGASKIVVTPSATVGSIGVVYMHLDRSAALAAAGLKPTLLHAGAFKVDGNSMGPLPDDARARIQAQIGAAHGLIVESIGRHRPQLGVEGARRTEAGLYLGQRAVQAGLADRVGSLADARAAALASRSSPPPAAASFPLTTAPATARAPALTSPTGETPMSAAESVSTLLDLPTLPPGYYYTQGSLVRAVDRRQRRAAANVSVARQLGGKTADDAWRNAVASVSGGGARKSEAAQPSASTGEADRWAEVIANQNARLSHRIGCR